MGDGYTLKTDHHADLTDKEAPSNGYVYVYVNNQSPLDIWFDNLQVAHTRGQILEETHYYPFGLTMAGISSKAAGELENKNKYNGIEFENDLELNIYDAQLRELDAQIGRWWQIDPLTEKMEIWSPYASNYDNPVKYADSKGDEPECCKGILQAAKDWLVNQTVIGLVKNTTETAKASINGNKTATLSLISFTGSKITEGKQVFTNGTTDQKQHFLTTIFFDAAAAVVFPKIPLGESAGAKSTPSGLGDLTKGEVKTIQSVVNAAERPLEIIGSAAKGTRRGVGTEAPIGKGPGTKSDIDYLSSHPNIPYYMGLQNKLPGIDPKTGVVPGVVNPYQGPGIRFEPNSKPVTIPFIKNP